MVLALPLALLPALLARTLRARLAYAALWLVLAAAMAATGSRTGLLGLGLFALLLPAAWAWAHGAAPRVQAGVLAASLVLAGLAGGAALWAAGEGSGPLARLRADALTMAEQGPTAVLRQSGRLELGLQATRLLGQAPLGGWGPGGFYRQVQNTRYRHCEPTGFVDNANNHYLQVLADMGAAGAVPLFALQLLPLWMLWRARRGFPGARSRLLAAVLLLTSAVFLLLLLTGPHTFAPSTALLHALALALAAAHAARHGPAPAGSARLLPLLLVLFLALPAVHSLGSHATSLGGLGYRAMRQAEWWPWPHMRNCTPVEVLNDRPVRWCGPNGVVQLPLPGPDVRGLAVEMRLGQPDIAENPVRITLQSGPFGPVTILVTDRNWHTVQLPLVKGNVFNYTEPCGGTTHYAVLSVDVERTFCPLEWNLSRDARHLGVAVSLGTLRYVH
jgi:hypothetical protein